MDYPMILLDRKTCEQPIYDRLTNFTVQEDFHRHLEGRVKQYQSSFPDELGIVIGNNEKQKDQLDLILLDYRKLREGIISSKRADAWAIEVYETSAKLSILARNTPQIATVLPHLVKSLHWPTRVITNRKEESLEKQMDNLRVRSTAPVSMRTRARFASYYLLHTLYHMDDLVAFQTLLKDLIYWQDDSDDKKEGDGGTKQNTRISASEATILFAISMFRIYLTNNYAGLASVIADPHAHDKFAWLILRSALPAIQARTWSVLRSSYPWVSDRAWLNKTLALPMTNEALQGFLKDKNWEDQVDESGAVLLRRAK